jgi:hypothetical protein
MTTLEFTALERAVLAEICRQSGAEGALLERQLATARVIRRDNSGAGFFTEFSVERTTAPLSSTERVFGNVSATIEGFQQPLLLFLFMKDGYAEMLEGATVTDKTDMIDFANVRFRIDPGRSPR